MAVLLGLLALGRRFDVVLPISTLVVGGLVSFIWMVSASRLFRFLHVRRTTNGLPRTECRLSPTSEGLAIHDPINTRLDATFGLYEELIDTFDSGHLSLTLPVPSNSIGSQLWCVIGARETMTEAMATGVWGPFRCSVLASEVVDPTAMKEKLEGSAIAFRSAIESSVGDETRIGFKLDLLQHEDQHLGQLLRYLLGLNIPVPSGWKQRFAL